MMEARIVTLPGDGVGPEVTAEAVRALRAVGDAFGHMFRFREESFGGASIDRHGVPLTEETLGACAASDAILLGAIGGPKWDGAALEARPERGLLALRKHLGLFANLRPVRPIPALSDAAPVKPWVLRGVDLLVVRELTGGLYFGEPRYTREEEGGWRAVDTLVYTSAEISRVSELAFRIAETRRRRVTLVDKANVLETSRLWRKIVASVASKHPAVTLEFMLVDTAAMRLMTAPSSFDVLLTENMFGDILTDEASVLTGSLGMAPSASLGSTGSPLFEPIHGSAPDIAGKGVANPIGAILSGALLLRYGLRLEQEAVAVEEAVGEVLAAGHRTKDLGGDMGTAEMGERIASRIRKR
jgi:3-isopropylmalate dehydrogenase